MVNSSIVHIQKYRVHYIEAGSGAPVMLLHGFAGSCKEWRPTVELLAAHGYRAIAVDGVGFGKSDKPADAPYSLELFAGLYDSLLDALGLEHATFVGHSFGGKCVLATAILHPKRVNRLVIADSEGFVTIPLFMRKAGLVPFLADAFLWMSKNPSLFRMQLAGTFYDPSRIPTYLEEHFRSVLYDKEKSQAMLQLSRCYDNHDLIKTGLRNRLHELRCRTLIIWGGQDRVFPPSCGLTARGEIPNSQLLIIPRCGHYPHIESFRSFHGALLGFLARGS